MRLLIFLGLALWGFGIAAAQGQSHNIEFERYTLDNGLRVILHQDKSTPIVAIAVNYHVGSKNEDPERTGFAHFFEHLLFEGSENIERGQFDKFIQNAGGTLNAYTTADNTCYFEILPSNQLDLGLWLESERMLHAKVDQKGVETQREVVKEEMRQRYDNVPYGSFQREMLQRLYRKHPYRWPVIGSMDHLNAASEADYIQFYKDFYVPNNAVLVIAGDFEPEAAKAVVAKYFATIPKGTKPIYRPEVVEPPLGKEVRDTIYDRIQLPGLFMAFRTPGIGQEDFYAVNMLTRLLAQGQSSRLNMALVDQKQLAIQVGNVAFQFEGPSFALAYAIAKVGVDGQAVEAAMLAEIERAQQEIMPEEEFQKLRNQIESDFVNQNATLFGIANNLANYELLHGDANLIKAEIDLYMKVTREDIQKAARKYFVKDNRVVLYYLPKAG